MKTTLLLGGTGFLGKHIKHVLHDKYDLFSVGSKDCNLLDFNATEKLFKSLRPEIVVCVAGKSGGIKSNADFPFDYWYENLAINLCWPLFVKYKVEKVVWIVPGCAYGSKTVAPIKEEYLFNGFPDIHPAPGSLSKAMAVTASYSARKQHGLKSTIIVPANCFGSFDYFDDEGAHVIPSILSKFRRAKEENKESVTLWGDGSPIRDFIFAEDLAKLIPFFIENDVSFNCENPCLSHICNVSTGIPVTIKNLVELIVKITEYEGNLIWDTSKPAGPKDKTFCNERLKSLGLSCPTSLEEGLRKTYDWYLKNRK